MFQTRIIKKQLHFKQPAGKSRGVYTMKQFTTPETLMQPMLMEVFTDKEKDTTLLREYYHGLKNKPNE